MKNPWVIIGVITAVLFGSAILYSGKANEENNEGVEIKQHIRGDLEAKVKLTEYSDFQCPACSNFQPILEEALAQFSGDVNLEYKHFPLPIHPFANQAAVAAEAAGQQGKFFEFHDLLFANQQEWSSAANPSIFFIKYAEELELDIDLFRRHIKASVLQDKVKAGFNEGRLAGVTGTPTIFLNGKKMEFNTLESFIGQIAFAVNPESASTTETAAGSEVRFGL